MMYACDPCARYNVIRVADKQSEPLMNEDIFLKFSTKQLERVVEKNIIGENIPFKVWGKVLSKDGKDALPKNAYVIEVDKIELVKEYP